MKGFDVTINKNQKILALGPESAGNFCVYNKGKIYYQEDLGDLIEENNFENYKKIIFEFLEKNSFVPDIICVDLHPEYKTSKLGEELADKYDAKLEKVQHHIAHVYSVLFDYTILASIPTLSFSKFIGIAADGTGYGLDGKIWGGEVFLISQNQKEKSKDKIKRIGHLENQLLCGADLSIKEPARMLLSILLKIKKPAEIRSIFEKFFKKEEFDLFVKMYEQKFNSVETSSTGRILDAASVLLGLCKNERNYKHEPVDLLEKKSADPFDLEPRITEKHKDRETEEQKNTKTEKQRNREIEKQYELNISYLFEWLLDNLDKDKGRLAATVQKYVIEGLINIAKKADSNLPIYFGGGMANNKIMSQVAKNNGVIMSKNIERGDYGLSLGQMMYCLRNEKF